jgi:transposase
MVPGPLEAGGQPDTGRRVLESIPNSRWGLCCGKPAFTRKGSLMSEPALYVGVDVAKRGLEVALLGAELDRLSVANEPEGHARIVEECRGRNVVAIVLEATGGYERALVAELAAASLPVVVVNPRQVRDFARATGQLAKTDAIDAAVLAQFGKAIKPEIRPIPDEKTRELQEKLARRRQLVTMRVAEEHRCRQATSKSVIQSIQTVLDVICRQIEQIDQDLDDVIRQTPIWRDRESLLRSVPGIGPSVARTLIAELPELGRCSRGELAALVGVAPRNRDSGTFRGRRTIGGGRATVRHALYMATIVGIRYNPAIHHHYQHLCKAGKAKKLAIVACMRKLLVILNAMLRDQETWKPDPETT